MGYNDHRWPLARREVNSVGPGPLAPQRCTLLSYDRLRLDVCLTSPLVNCACVQSVSALRPPEKRGGKKNLTTRLLKADYTLLVSISNAIRPDHIFFKLVHWLSNQIQVGFFTTLYSLLTKVWAFIRIITPINFTYFWTYPCYYLFSVSIITIL